MSTIEARRIARSRKILENSEQRLAKIAGVEQKTTVTEFDGGKFGTINDFEPNHEIINGVTCADLRTDSFNYFEHHLSESSVITQNNLEDEKVVSNKHGKVLNIHVNSKLLFMLILALIQNLIFIMSDIFQMDSIKAYSRNIFLSLIAYDVYIFIFYPAQLQSPNFLNLLLSNYLNFNVTIYVKFLVCILQLLQDMMVYFFTFIIFYKFVTIF